MKPKKQIIEKIRKSIFERTAQERADMLVNEAISKLKPKSNKIKLTEEEFRDFLIHLYEDVSTVGLDTYKLNHKNSGKLNSDALKATKKKMDEYLKDGSKGKFETNPKDFPKSNGEMTKMEKKARINNSEEEEFIEDYKGGGLENLDYDVVKPNDERINDYIEGSEKTGNSSDYANAVKTDVNSKINKRRKKNAFSNEKKNSYKRFPQPVIEEAISKKEEQLKVINEELRKITHLFSYNKPSQ